MKTYAPADILDLTKDERKALVLEAYDEVLKDLGKEAPHASVNRKTQLVQQKLPLRPMYDDKTIGMIISGSY